MLARYSLPRTGVLELGSFEHKGFARFGSGCRGPPLRALDFYGIAWLCEKAAQVGCYRIVRDFARNSRF